MYKENFWYNWRESLKNIRIKYTQIKVFHWEFEKYCPIKQDLIILWLDKDKDIIESNIEDSLYIRKNKISKEYFSWYKYLYILSYIKWDEFLYLPWVNTKFYEELYYNNKDETYLKNIKINIDEIIFFIISNTRYTYIDDLWNYNISKEEIDRIINNSQYDYHKKIYNNKEYMCLIERGIYQNLNRR